MLGFDPSYTQVVGKDRNYDKWTAEFQCCTVSAQMTQGWLAWVQQFCIFPVSQCVGQNHNNALKHQGESVTNEMLE